MESTIVLTQVVTFLLVMIVGVFLGRSGVIDEHTNNHIARLLNNVAMPLMVVASFQEMEYSAEDAAYLTKALVVSAGILLMSVLLGYVLYRRVEPGKRGILRFSLVFSNAGYMGLPLIQGIYGSEGVFFASVFLIPYNILLWTYGIAQFTDGKDPKQLKKLLLNPGIIGIVCSVVMYLLSIRLPRPVVAAADMMGDMTGPLGMLVIGVLLSRSRLRDLFCGWEMYVSALMRVLVLPLLVYGALSLLGIDGTVTRILAVLTGMPVAVSNAVFAETYERDAHFASRIVAFSTLLSMASMPLILFWIG